MIKKITLTFVMIAFLAVPFFSYAQLSSDCLNNPSGSNLCNPINYSQDDIGIFIVKIIAGFTSFFAFTALLFVVYSGFRMIISQGNAESLTVAKDALKWSVSGLVLAIFAFVIVYAVGDYIGAKDLSPGSYIGNNPVRNPLQDSTFLSLLTRMLTGFLSIVGIFAVLMIIISGFRYITARGDEEQVTSAKQGLQWSVIGLGIIVLSYVIVRASLSFFGG